MIVDDLWLGSCGAAGYKDKLKRNGITHILTVANGFDPLHPKDFKYKVIKIDDKVSEDLLEYFPECMDFIDDCMKEGGKVLVHCIAGKSRSVSVVLAWMMLRKSFELQAAIDLVMEKRKVVTREKINFLKQLEIYQELKCNLAVQKGLNVQYFKYKQFDLVKKMQDQVESWKDGSLDESMLAEVTTDKNEGIVECLQCQYALCARSNIVHYSAGHCQFIYVEPMQWMMETIKGTKSGDLSCPGCTKRIGNFSWLHSVSSKCSCYVSITPVFRLVTNKVHDSGL